MSFTETLDAMRGLSSKWPQTTRKLVEDKANGTACPWVMDFVEEMAAFPSGAHDDQVDCYSQANAYYNDNTFDIRSLIT